MKFADKMKDVEMHPYMLAIYKDNEHHHLLRHALESWEIRSRGLRDSRMNLQFQNNNPITYAKFPPMELIQRYNVSPQLMIGSKHIHCQKVLRWALMELLANEEFWQLTATSFWHFTAPNIAWDDELIFAFARADLASFFFLYDIPVTDEQRSVLTICA